ncbi:hypothetical protein FRB99_006645 [Tulasnella sp. 403]|nr:hypothetical protein FRB99_006645 [Tulasnella sp. 403]
MDIWEDDDDLTTQKAHADREWTRLSDNFINDGYREGITAGKEGALQEGFDDGFASVGVPLGRHIGTLRGIASGIAALCQSRTSSSARPSTSPPFVSPVFSQISPEVATEVQSIADGLNQISFLDIVPPDQQAEEHNRLHAGETENPTETDASDPLGDLSSAFQTLGTLDSPAHREQRRQEALAVLRNLESRLSVVLQHLGLPIQLDES